MDLLLWRHAHAEDGGVAGDDLERALTPKGHAQAQRMANWLRPRLPTATRVLCSPALRTRQTAQALGGPLQHWDALLPDRDADALLDVVGWPLATGTTLVIGHQPTLGDVVAQLLGMPQGSCAIKKGALWWLRGRVREGQQQTVVVTVISPHWL